MILPTRKLLLLLLLPAPVMLIWREPAGLVVGIAMNGAIIALALLDLRLSPKPSALEIQRVIPPFLSLNAHQQIGWNVRNASDREIDIVVTDDTPEGIAAEPELVRGRIRPRARAELRYRVRPTRRGQYTFGDTHVRCRSQLGLLTRQWRQRGDHVVKVYPNVQNLRYYELSLRRNRLREFGLRSTAELGKASQFDSLREYLPGDDVGDIAWKATARRNRLIVREYGVERSQNIVVMIDCGRLMTTQADGVSRLDYAINATLLLTYAAMKQGDSIGLLGFSDAIEAYVPPTRGQGALRRMNEALYRLEPCLREPDYDRACRYLALRHRKRSLIVIFTDVIDRTASAMLLAHTARFARRHISLCVTMRNLEVQRLAALDPTRADDCYVKAVALESDQRRRKALEHMRRDGVDVLDVEPRGLTPAVLTRYLTLKRSGRL